MRCAASSVAVLGLSLLAPAAASQPGSHHALRFFGTGIGPPGQQDRVRIAIDDNAPGPDASQPCDVGAGSFSIDLWIRGTLADNPTAHSGGGEFFDFRWIEGNIVVDRDTWGDSSRDWGISLAGGRVRFGTGRADSAALDSEHTLEGTVNVLTGAWRHVCCVRDRDTGIKRIYIDGTLDIASPPNRSRDDISYPNQGVSGKVTPWCPYIVLAAEKHDAGTAYPSFAGYLDEFRVWSIALSAEDVQRVMSRVQRAGTQGLVGNFRFEEGAGSTVADTSLSGQSAGQLIAGSPGNGQWVARADDVFSTAPVIDCRADFDGNNAVEVTDIFEFLTAWFAGEPAADFDGADGIQVPDIFAFLAAWFAGCAG